ncbi:MAG: type I-B CRISPR-associated protein Cas5 [Bacteroidales bacterium]|jgi:CRISPR-associated protein Cas5h|nr:type I-B CRISPR-associated protein Cas5 [Bacteroidales bacterium]MCK4638001.1 type I-B CRISPR-associated protein Cas5 [Bacteroidales bacterium]
MKKLISFTIKAEKGFLKKPDINDGIYLTYNMLHKPAILGILGAIIGLEGYKENGKLPDYYEKLKDIPVGIEPIGAEKGNFQKTTITYNNTTGLASNEQGGNLMITEQTLINPSYKIYLLLDLEDENQKQIYENIKNQKAVYLPYLGKNDYSLWWDKCMVEEYEWEYFEKDLNFKISTLFKKDEAIVNFIAKAIGRRALAGKKNDFNYFERLPINFNEDLFQYNYGDFAFSNAKLEEDVAIDSKNLYKIKNIVDVKSKAEAVFLY